MSEWRQREFVPPTGGKQNTLERGTLVTDSAPAGCVNLHLTVTYVTYEKLAQPTCKGSI